MLHSKEEGHKDGGTGGVAGGTGWGPVLYSVRLSVYGFARDTCRFLLLCGLWHRQIGISLLERHGVTRHHPPPMDVSCLIFVNLYTYHRLYFIPITKFFGIKNYLYNDFD